MTCSGSPSASWRPMAASSPPTSWCRPTRPTSPRCCSKIRAAKPDLVISNLAGNQITNFLKQYSEFGLTFPVAGFGFDTALAWARRQGQFRRYLALRLAPPDRHALDQDLRRGLHQEIRQAAGEPGLGRLHRREDHGPIDERAEEHRHAEDPGALGEGRQVRCDEAAPGLASAPRTISSSARCTRSRRCRRRR